MELLIAGNSIIPLLLSEKKITMGDIIKSCNSSCDFAFQTMKYFLGENYIRDCKNGTFEVIADETTVLSKKYKLSDEEFQSRCDSFMPEMFPVLEFITTHPGAREKEIPKRIISRKMPLRDFLILNLAFCVNEKFYCQVAIDDLKQRYFAYLEKNRDDPDVDDDGFLDVDDFKDHFFDIDDVMRELENLDLDDDDDDDTDE